MGTLISGNRAMEFGGKNWGDRGKDALKRVSSPLRRSLDLVPDMVKSQGSKEQLNCALAGLVQLCVEVSKMGERGRQDVILESSHGGQDEEGATEQRGFRRSSWLISHRP